MLSQNVGSHGRNQSRQIYHSIIFWEDSNFSNNKVLESGEIDLIWRKLLVFNELFEKKLIFLKAFLNLEVFCGFSSFLRFLKFFVLFWAFWEKIIF